MKDYYDYLMFAKGYPKLAGRKSNVDFLGMRILSSMAYKFQATAHCLKEVLCQVSRYRDEQDELHRTGISDGVESAILNIKYETYLNAIYSLMETVAYLLKLLFPELNLPPSFHKQKKWVNKFPDKLKWYYELLNNTEWYNEIRLMRSEAVHFLKGIVTSNEDEDPGYFNMILSERGSSQANIEIKNLYRHSQELYNHLSVFLNQLCHFLLEYIDKDKRISNICIVEGGLIGAKMLSYNEWVNHEPGICQATKLDCPKAKTCLARQNAG